MHQLVEFSYQYVNMELRKNILYKSLNIENRVNNFISQLLPIENPKDSISFGKGNQVLSFNQKVNLLIDIGALKKEQIDKFQKFMYVRNKFMHDIEISSFEICNKISKNVLINFFSRNYTLDKNLSIEIQLEEGFEQLHSELITITNQLYFKISQKLTKELKAKGNAKLIKLYDESLTKIKEQISPYLEEYEPKNPNAIKDIWNSLLLEVEIMKKNLWNDLDD